MPLYTLMREYEERRQALIDQLKNNPTMDPAVQHQIYGAIKEIENFLKAIEFQLAANQEQQISIDLARDRPRPFVERTKKIAGKVRSGTKVVAGRVKKGARRVAQVPKQYIAKRREKRRMKKEIERELLRRLQENAAQAGDLPAAVHTDLKQDTPKLPEMPVQDELQPEYSSTDGLYDQEIVMEQPKDEVTRPSSQKKSARTAKKSLKKASKKTAKKSSKKSSQKPVQKSKKKSVNKSKKTKKTSKNKSRK